MPTVVEMYSNLPRGDKLRGGLTAKWIAEHCDEVLGAGETPRCVGIGLTAGRPWLVVVTNCRFYAARIGKLTGANVDVPLDRLSAVTVHGLRGHLTFAGAGYAFEFTLAERANEFAGAMKLGPSDPAAAAQQPVAPSDGVATATDPMAKLSQLAQLRDAGVITEAEFEAKKAELLKLI